MNYFFCLIKTLGSGTLLIKKSSFGCCTLMKKEIPTIITWPQIMWSHCWVCIYSMFWCLYISWKWYYTCNECLKRVIGWICMWKFSLPMFEEMITLLFCICRLVFSIFLLHYTYHLMLVQLIQDLELFFLLNYHQEVWESEWLKRQS